MKSRTEMIKELVFDELDRRKFELDGDEDLRQVQIMVKVNTRTGKPRSVSLWRESERTLASEG